MAMVFLDSNIPMYLVGADHPNKLASRAILARLVAEKQRLVTDAEVFQEILHRYVAIQRREAIQPAFDVLLGVVDEVFPVDLRGVVGAKELVQAYPSVSARDAIHLAIMKARGVGTIFTFDRGFDGVPGLSVIRS